MPTTPTDSTLSSSIASFAAKDVATGIFIESANLFNASYAPDILVPAPATITGRSANAILSTAFRI